MKKLLLMTALALMLFVPAAQAGGLSVGASVMQTGVEIDEVDFDEDDTGMKAFVGYRFGKFFAVEGGYYDFGEPGDGPIDVEITAFNLSAKGILPIGERIELSAKAGMFKWDTESDAAGDDDDNDPGYGVGFAFLLGEKIELRAEYEMIDLDSDVDVEIISVGAAWRF